MVLQQSPEQATFRRGMLDVRERVNAEELVRRFRTDGVVLAQTSGLLGGDLGELGLVCVERAERTRSTPM